MSCLFVYVCRWYEASAFTGRINVILYSHLSDHICIRHRTSATTARRISFVLYKKYTSQVGPFFHLQGKDEYMIS